MSRVFSDTELLSWAAFATGGRHGLPDRPKIVFLCLSDPDRRSRFVEHAGDNASAQGVLRELPDDALRLLLAQSVELD
jgi:hypothetical protein